jgi:hypothetical protein
MNLSSKALSEGAFWPPRGGQQDVFSYTKHLAVLMAGDFAAELAKSELSKRCINMPRKKLANPLSLRHYPPKLKAKAGFFHHTLTLNRTFICILLYLFQINRINHVQKVFNPVSGISDSNNVRLSEYK